jgi:hypothetical protein
MLQSSLPEAAECYARAHEARERADSAQNLALKAILLDAERRWLKLAASYEAAARVTQFLGQEPILYHPVCESCGVAMWLVGIKELSHSSKRYSFECKACDLTTTETVTRPDRSY